MHPVEFKVALPPLIRFSAFWQNMQISAFRVQKEAEWFLSMVTPRRRFADFVHT
jgi:hypothetical protein